jgi:hypothetical protein
MSYVKVTGGVPEEYSFSQLRNDNPNVSFPTNPSEAILADYDVYIYTQDPMPTADVVTIGDFYQDNGEWKRAWNSRDFTDEERRSQMIVSNRQARLALNQAGLLANVEAAIAGMSEPDKTIVTLEWEYASEIERTSPWVISMGASLGLTETQLDDLFVAADLL